MADEIKFYGISETLFYLKEYEKDLKSIISGMGKFTEPVLAKLKSKESNIA